MNFEMSKALEILSGTPDVLRSLLGGNSEEWIMSNEGPDTWSPFDIVGHLIHGERTDWIPRMDKIMAENGNKTFEPFDRFAQFQESADKSLQELLEDFEKIRNANLAILLSRQIGATDLVKTGVHPTLGEVTLSNLLSTWVAHDLGHIAQIARVMAKQYKDEIGPWMAFMPVMLDRSTNAPAQ